MGRWCAYQKPSMRFRPLQLFLSLIRSQHIPNTICLIFTTTQAQRSLISLLQGIEGARTTVELRSEDAVIGVINNVDECMK